MKKIMIIFCLIAISLLAGFRLGFTLTMKNIKAYVEPNETIILDVYGQEYEYKE